MKLQGFEGIEKLLKVLEQSLENTRFFGDNEKSDSSGDEHGKSCFGWRFRHLYVMGKVTELQPFFLCWSGGVGQLKGLEQSREIPSLWGK